jgi:hypothetical protein
MFGTKKTIGDYIQSSHPNFVLFVEFKESPNSKTKALPACLASLVNVTRLVRGMHHWRSSGLPSPAVIKPANQCTRNKINSSERRNQEKQGAWLELGGVLVFLHLQ